MKEFLFSIWFISLSSNLSFLYIFIMSVRHVFADFRLIFVNSCSRRDGASFSLFYKIILYCIFYKIFVDIVSAHK